MQMTLGMKRTEIRVQFWHVPGNLYKRSFGTDLDRATNKLVIRVQPDEAIYLKINNKVPGLGMRLDHSNLNLHYAARYGHKLPGMSYLTKDGVGPAQGQPEPDMFTKWAQEDTTELFLCRYTTCFSIYLKEIPDAYERLLLDAVKGELRLFIRSDELDAAWVLFTPLLKEKRRSSLSFILMVVVGLLELTILLPSTMSGGETSMLSIIKGDMHEGSYHL